jgi:hypothetical protein
MSDVMLLRAISWTLPQASKGFLLYFKLTIKSTFFKVNLLVFHPFYTFTLCRRATLPRLQLHSTILTLRFLLYATLRAQ